MKYYVREYEKQRDYIYPACSTAVGRRIETGITIVDLKGGSSILLTPRCYSFVKMASAICQNYYPEMLDKYICFLDDFRMFIVNCSWVLKAGWVVVKAFLDAKTCKKIHIFDGKYLHELTKYIEPSNLPQFLGGTCECKPNGCLMQMEGPWKEYYDKFPSETDEKETTIPQAPLKWKV